MNSRDLILPSLAADALCLGPHWVYSEELLRSGYPSGISGYDAPRSRYHEGKTAGDLTHYGDQTVALIASISARGGYSAAGWAEDWVAFWAGKPNSYLDGATSGTLANHRAGKPAPSGSHDLSASARLAPVLAALREAPLEARIAAAKSQNALTHGDPAVIESAEYFTRLVDLIATTGLTVSECAEKAAAAGDYPHLNPQQVLARVRDVAGQNPAEAGEAFGRACNVQEAFPLTLYFLLAFEEDPQESLLQNALLGGDCSARGMILGYVFGAAHSTCWMPPEWTAELRVWPEVSGMIG